MENDTKIICCPKCKKGLQHSNSAGFEGMSGTWKCPECSSNYQSDDSFIYFIKEDEVFRFSKRTEFIRSIYAKFYTPLTKLMFLPCGGDHNARQEVLENLEIKPGSRILETGIGTGDNVHFLDCKLDGCRFYGLDNQVRMIRACAKNADKWHRPVKLYLANAEDLPFKDNSFDVVFQLGAFNLFQQKKQAIEEMIRVARPGSRIVIADETDKATKLFAIFIGRQPPVVPPIDLVPSSMLETYFKIIWNGYGYLITFRKPVE